VRTGALPSAPEPLTSAQALGWSGLLLFRETPMAQVAEVLADRFDVRVDVSDELAAEAVTATFQPGETAEQILDALVLTLGAQVERVEGGFVVR
jgi:ferric-dicitrate binding protein FerR (iron transport regulator)